jgi:hypothetical protein
MAGAPIGGGTFNSTSPGWNPGYANMSPTDTFGNPSSFAAAAKTQASDYDTIMKNYANIATNALNNPITAGSVSPTSVSAPTPVSAGAVGYSNVAPSTADYQQSSDVSNSLGTLADLSSTGGYTAAGIADIRARDTAPTKSIYANAQQNIERQRALGGGYSPNFDATQAQLARDESNQISTTDTAAEAGIAQNVAANRIAAAPGYASAAAAANAAKTQAGEFNASQIQGAGLANAQGQLSASEANAQLGLGAAEFNSQGQFQAGAMNAQNRLGASEFNTQMGLDAALANRQGALGATQGMANLYGTTPALTNTFGNQVIQAGQLGQGQQGLDQRNLALYGSMA